MPDICQLCGLPVPANATVCVNGHPYQRNSTSGSNPTPQPGLSSVSRQAPANAPQGGPPHTLSTLIRQYPGARQQGRINIFFRIKCPFCAFKFHPNDCAVYSTTRQDKNGQRVLLRKAPSFRPIARFGPIPLEGPEFAQNMACRECPRCRNLLPYRFELDTCFSIAMVGDAFSGKSHYLAALLHQLMGDEILQQEKVRVRLWPINPLAKTRWKEFHETLFENHGSLPGTARFAFATEKELAENYSVREPLIFRMEIGYLAENVDSAINLVFYDISGEDIASETVIPLYGWPILEAQAIIYFADTLNMERVLDELSKLPDTHPQLESASDMIKNKKRTRPHELLECILPVFKRYNRLDARGKVNTPVAIMLSKSDILDTIARRNKFGSARFLQPGLSNGLVDLEDLRIVDSDVRTFLGQFGETGLIQDREYYFTTASFFATSATGCAPENNHYASIKSRRCLDPLLWLLLKLTESRS